MSPVPSVPSHPPDERWWGHPGTSEGVGVIAQGRVANGLVPEGKGAPDKRQLESKLPRSPAERPYETPEERGVGPVRQENLPANFGTPPFNPPQGLIRTASDAAQEEVPSTGLEGRQATASWTRAEIKLNSPPSRNRRTDGQPRLTGQSQPTAQLTLG